MGSNIYVTGVSNNFDNLVFMKWTEYGKLLIWSKKSIMYTGTWMLSEKTFHKLLIMYWYQRNLLFNTGIDRY